VIALPTLALALVGISDYSTHAPPDIELPPAGSWYTDPVFGTRILRVTDSRDGTACVHAYSYWPAFNRDDTRLLIECDGVARLLRFDPEAGTIVADGTLAGDDGPKVEMEGAFWSHSDPDVIYALDGTRLWRLDVAHRGQAGATLVHDFTGLFDYSFQLYQMSMSEDEQVFTFHSRDSGGDKLDVAVYDRAADRTLVFPRGSFAIDESKIDKQGRWVIVDSASDTSGFRLWDWRAGTVLKFGWNQTDRPGGHEDLGHTSMVNGDVWSAGLIWRSFDDPREPKLRSLVSYLDADGAANWTLSDHVSYRTDAETFVVASTYGGDGSWSAFEKEIYLAYTDGSGFVRLAHSRTTDQGGNYWAQPRAVVDRLGRYVVYTSTLGQSSRLDVMVLAIPPALWPPPGASAAGTSGGDPAAAPGGTGEDGEGIPHAGGCAVGSGRARRDAAGAAALMVTAIGGCLARRRRGRRAA
jgi:hypothetical protein